MEPASAVVSVQMAKDWLPKLAQTFARIRKERKAELDHIGDLFGDPELLARRYVEPDCQQFNPADSFVEEGSNVIRTPVFEHLQRGFFSGSQEAGTGKNQLFVLADAGMGKSSLLVMLKLAQLGSFWPRETDCVLMKLGQGTLDELAPITARRGKVLLLDALDEDPLAWGRVHDRVLELLRATDNFHRVIITCRTQFFSGGEDPFNRRGQVELGGFLCPVIYLSLFDDEKVGRYLQRHFPRGLPDWLLRRENPRIGVAKGIVERMRSLRARPMLLAHIEDLLSASHQDWTEYTLYKALVRAWLQREQRKNLDKVASVEEIWLACTRLALRLHQGGVDTISEAELERLVQTTPELRHLRAMDVGGRSLLNKTSNGSFRFAHRTVAEFLVTHAVLEVYGIVVGRLRGTDAIARFLDGGLFDPKLRGADLGGLDLLGLDLGQIPLSRARMKGCNLRGADLSRCLTVETGPGPEGAAGALWQAEAPAGSPKITHRQTFAGALYDDATRWFAGKPPPDAHRLGPGADLRAVDLRGADLRGADLRGASLRDAPLEGARVAGMHVDGTTMAASRWTPSFLASLRARGAIIDRADQLPDSLRRIVFGPSLEFVVWFFGTDAPGDDQLEALLAARGLSLVERALGGCAWWFVCRGWGWDGEQLAGLSQDFEEGSILRGHEGKIWRSDMVAPQPDPWLGDLLRSLFNGEELRRWSREHFDPCQQYLPGPAASDGELSLAAARWHNQQATDASRLVAALVAARPRREADIRYALHAWKPGGASPAPEPRPERRSSKARSTVSSAARWELFRALVLIAPEPHEIRMALRESGEERIIDQLPAGFASLGERSWALVELLSAAPERCVSLLALLCELRSTRAPTVDLDRVEGLWMGSLQPPATPAFRAGARGSILQEALQELCLGLLTPPELAVVLAGACGLWQADHSRRSAVRELMRWALGALEQRSPAGLFRYLREVCPPYAARIDLVEDGWEHPGGAAETRLVTAPTALIASPGADRLLQNLLLELVPPAALLPIARSAFGALTAAWMPSPEAPATSVVEHFVWLLRRRPDQNMIVRDALIAANPKERRRIQETLAQILSVQRAPRLSLRD